VTPATAQEGNRAENHFYAELINNIAELPDCRMQPGPQQCRQVINRWRHHQITAQPFTGLLQLETWNRELSADINFMRDTRTRAEQNINKAKAELARLGPPTEGEPDAVTGARYVSGAQLSSGRESYRQTLIRLKACDLLQQHISRQQQEFAADMNKVIQLPSPEEGRQNLPSGSPGPCGFPLLTLNVVELEVRQSVGQLVRSLIFFSFCLSL